MSQSGLNLQPGGLPGCHSSNVRIGKRTASSASQLRCCEHASGSMAGLDIAAVLYGVGPQSWLRAVTGRILDLAFLEDNLDGADERLHLNRFVLTVRGQFKKAAPYA
ncbi:hypothetical protein R75461_07374 [Paraburkholderia nemoris]|nr:hypothetical protein R75461_07374 [Paraburkholderia nemoris]